MLDEHYEIKKPEKTHLLFKEIDHLPEMSCNKITLWNIRHGIQDLVLISNLDIDAKETVVRICLS